MLNYQRDPEGIFLFKEVDRKIDSGGIFPPNWDGRQEPPNDTTDFVDLLILLATT